MDTSVKASSNWTRSGGCDFAKAIQTKVTHEDIFLKPELEEILSEERAVLLSTPSRSADSSVACELQLRVFPRYKIEAVTLVCSAPKLEVFLGAQREYCEMLYGAVITDETQNTAEEPLLSYRYDIEVERSGVVEVTLKLLTCCDEICIYGLLLQIAPNPNGITTLLPTAINLNNVQQMLNSSGQKLSPGAEKCKMFMELYKKNTAANSQPPSSGGDGSSIADESPKSLLDQMRRMMLTYPPAMDAAESGNGGAAELPPTLDNIIKSHIDLKVGELETKINARLDGFAAQQSAKLDRILKLLEDQRQ